MINLDDFEEFAYKSLDRNALNYYRSGANAECTLRDNREAFSKIKIWPRFLHKDLTNRSLSTSFLGSKVSLPIGAAPTALQRMAHPEGEIATVKGKQLGPMIF